MSAADALAALQAGILEVADFCTEKGERTIAEALRDLVAVSESEDPTA